MAAQNPNPNPPTVFHSTHLNLVQLKRQRELEQNGYIHNVIPTYPECVEFHTSKVSHVTNTDGLRNIMKTGFKGGREDFVWWSSNIPDEEFEEAQRRYLNREFPSPEDVPEDSAPEEVEEQFLKKFATSPAFQDKSRYGNFRFTFRLDELLQKYKDQFCGEGEPVLRVYDTKVYKKEIMYTVVVHSPEVTEFDECPLLVWVGDGAVCAYNEGRIIWRAQAMCGSHKYKLIKEPVRVRAVECSEQYYVWDHVTVAFHIPPYNAIKVETEHLLNSLSACEMCTEVPYRPGGLSLAEAEAEVERIKEEYQAIV